VAGLLKRELGIEVGLEHGPYGSFKILSDGREIFSAMAAFGLIPSNADILAAVRREMNA
jgi:hypothetical protein